jgi:ribonuclease Z
MMGRKVPLVLYGPEVLKEYLSCYRGFFGPLPFDLELKIPSGKNDLVYECDKLTVRALALKHRTTAFGYLFREKLSPLNVRKDQIEAFGLGIADIIKVKRGEDYMTESGEVLPNSRLTLPPFHQRSYAYLSDTRFAPELAEWVKGVDLLYHEATFAGKDKELAAKTQHSTAAEAAQLAKLAGVKQLIIGHFSSRYKDVLLLEREAREIFKPTAGVHDGDTYSIPRERQSGE